MAEVKSCEFSGHPERAILSQAGNGRCNDYPKGVHSSEWKRTTHCKCDDIV